MANPTTNLGVTLGTVGGSDDSWGTITNDAFQSFDDIFSASGTQVSMRQTGGTIDGTVIGGTTPAAITGTTITASTALVSSGTLAVTSTSTLTGKVTCSGEVEVDGVLNHDGSTVGFYGATPASQASVIADPSIATVSGSGDDTTINNNFTNVETAIEAIIDALQAIGIVATS